MSPMPLLSVSGGRGVVFLWVTIASHRNEISLYGHRPNRKKREHLVSLGLFETFNDALILEHVFYYLVKDN